MRNGLVDPFNSDAVVRLIGCSGQYADQLTADARERAREEREARVVALKAEGKTVRDIAGELGVPKSTVSDAVRKKNSAETRQADKISHRPKNPSGKRSWTASKRPRRTLGTMRSRRCAPSMSYRRLARCSPIATPALTAPLAASSTAQPFGSIHFGRGSMDSTINADVRETVGVGRR